MARRSKLKSALEERADAIQFIRTELYDATGLTAEPDFQEIDQPGELLIEVRLPDVGGYPPDEVAKLVTSESRQLGVLSAWTEQAEPGLPRTVPSCVVDVFECEALDLALRAHRDGLPTARWHQPSPMQSPHWLLIVPGIDAGRKAVVGTCRRTGYYYRFSASKARSLVLTPALA